MTGVAMRSGIVGVVLVGLSASARADERPAACIDALKRLTDATTYAGMFRIGDLHSAALGACSRDRKAKEEAQRAVDGVMTTLKDPCRNAFAALDNGWYFDAKEGKRQLQAAHHDGAIAKIESSCPAPTIQQARTRWANLFADRDARHAEGARQAESIRQAEAAKQEAARQAEAARKLEAARQEETARVAEEKAKPTCADVEMGLKKYLSTRGAWDAIDETRGWLEDAKRSCPPEKVAELEKLIADDNAAIAKEQRRQQQAQADDDWAQDRARASAAYKRAERAEEICINYGKIERNKAQLTSKSERDVDRATGTTNVDLKRRVAAVNMNIEKLIKGLKDEYIRAGGPKSDVAKGKPFWCGYRPVRDVYSEEKARALTEANKAHPQPPAPTRSSQTATVLWKSKSGPAPTSKEVCRFPEWNDLRSTLVTFCTHKNSSKKRQLICNGVLIPAFSTCDAPVDFRDRRSPVMVGEDNAYCVPTNYENADE
jgi:hypothetical protein